MNNELAALTLKALMSLVGAMKEKDGAELKLA